MKTIFSLSNFFSVFCICLFPNLNFAQTTNWYKSGVFWPIMSYESAFIGDENQFILQAPDYFAYGSVRYIISYEDNVSYSVGIGLPSLQFGIQKTLFKFYGMPINLKISGGTALAYLLNLDGKIIVGIYKTNSMTISTDFTIGGHTSDFMDSPVEQYVQYGLYMTNKIWKRIDLGGGIGVSNIFYTKSEPDPNELNTYHRVHKNRMTWQLAGTITYFFGSK